MFPRTSRHVSEQLVFLSRGPLHVSLSEHKYYVRTLRRTSNSSCKLFSKNSTVLRLKVYQKQASVLTYAPETRTATSKTENVYRTTDFKTLPCNEEISLLDLSKNKTI